MPAILGGLGGTSLVVGVRWSVRGKDAGSVRSRRLRARLRTPPRGEQRGPATQTTFRQVLQLKQDPRRQRLRAAVSEQLPRQAQIRVLVGEQNRLEQVEAEAGVLLDPPQQDAPLLVRERVDLVCAELLERELNPRFQVALPHPHYLPRPRMRLTG